MFRKTLEDSEAESTQVPSHILLRGPLRKDIAPHRYLSSDQVFVIEVKCAEIVSSDQYPTGLTCRFPRCSRIRRDKSVADIATWADLEHFKNHGLRSETLEKRQRAPDKSPHKAQKLAKVDDSFTLNLEDGPVEDAIFEGQVFCVKTFAGGTESSIDVGGEIFQFTRESIVDLIHKHGGINVSNPVDGCWVVSGSKITVEVKAIISSAEYNIVHFSLIIDCIREKRWRQPKPRHFIARSKRYQSFFEGNCDKYGDSYVDDLDDRDLSYIILKMSAKPLTLDELFMDCEDEGIRDMIQKHNPLFGGNTLIYVDMFNSLGETLPSDESTVTMRWQKDVNMNSSLLLPSSMLRFHGARLSAELTNEVTHVMLDPFRPERRKAIADRIRELRMINAESFEKRLVFPSWTNDCVRACDFDSDSSHDASSFLREAG